MIDEWGRRLKADMAYWGIRRSDVAQELEITPAYVGMLINGDRNSSYYGISREELRKTVDKMIAVAAAKNAEQTQEAK